jgi:hypothetical protein
MPARDGDCTNKSGHQRGRSWFPGKAAAKAQGRVTRVASRGHGFAGSTARGVARDTGSPDARRPKWLRTGRGALIERAVNRYGDGHGRVHTRVDTEGRAILIHEAAGRRWRSGDGLSNRASPAPALHDSCSSQKMFHKRGLTIAGRVRPTEVMAGYSVGRTLTWSPF